MVRLTATNRMVKRLSRPSSSSAILPLVLFSVSRGKRSRECRDQCVGRTRTTTTTATITTISVQLSRVSWIFPSSTSSRLEHVLCILRIRLHTCKYTYIYIYKYVHIFIYIYTYTFNPRTALVYPRSSPQTARTNLAMVHAVLGQSLSLSLIVSSLSPLS